MITRISQSFLKDYLAYKNHELCGEMLVARWERKLEFKPTESMELGTYLEYKAFGNLAKGGKIPEPQRTQKGELTAEYKRCEEHAKIAKTWIEETMGLEIIERGYYIQKENHNGTIDLVVKCTKRLVFDDMHRLKKGDLIVIDVKYSGQLDDKWSKHGWMWMPEQRAYHGLQAKEYHYLTELPFYFFVKGMGTKNPYESKFFRVTITPEEMERHLIFAQEAFDEIKFQASINGLDNYPSVEKCCTCPVKETCRSRHEYPDAKMIQL